MQNPFIGVALLSFGAMILLGCKDRTHDARDSSHTAVNIDNDSMIGTAICCDLFSHKNPCASFIKAWNLDKGISFIAKSDLSYEEALSYAAFIDVNVRTEGIGSWAASLGDFTPDDGSSGEYPQGQRLERLIHLRELTYTKLGITNLNDYFTSWKKLEPLFASDPNDAFAKEKSIESDYRYASCKFLHALYMRLERPPEEP